MLRVRNTTDAADIETRRRGGGLGTFERYLSLWVALCMAAGIALGKLLPSAVAGLRGLEFVKGSQISAPIAVLTNGDVAYTLVQVSVSRCKCTLTPAWCTAS
jgi:ACR3 family arsenite transporter